MEKWPAIAADLTWTATLSCYLVTESALFYPLPTFFSLQTYPESKLKISEEDLVPVTRQRSNTLPKSFGSQLEKEEDKKQDLSDKSAKPAVEATLESVQKKLQEKRAETSRPEDIKVHFRQIRVRCQDWK